jgi:hypothetical protein
MLAGSSATQALASPGWSSPFRLTAPSRVDLVPAQIAFSSTGATAIGYAAENADNPSSSSGYLLAGTTARPLGKPQQIRGVQRVLDLSYDGSKLELLVGTSPRGRSCCSSAQTVAVGPKGVLGRPHTLLRGLAGATIGALATISGRRLAAVATERGVWVSQSGPGERFGGSHRLTATSVQPAGLSLSTVSGGTIVAWNARAAQPAPGGWRIFVAQGSSRTRPRTARAAVIAAPDHWINELTLARRVGGATVAWVESWYDVMGAYHAQVMASDLGGTPRPFRVSSSTELASGLAFASNTRGDQAMAWKSCTSSGTCSLSAVVRRARHRFGVQQRLSLIDASQAPVLAVGRSGEALLAWIQDGHVVAARALAAGAPFGTERLVSRTNYAADLALAFGPNGQALAVWTQGTASQSLSGAVYSAR